MIAQERQPLRDIYRCLIGTENTLSHTPTIKEFADDLVNAKSHARLKTIFSEWISLKDFSNFKYL